MLNPRVQAALAAGGESALNYYGRKSQMVAACEEMGELTRALCKVLLNKPIVEQDVIDEIADVTIMVSQMRLAFGPEAVDERILFKLERTLNYIRDKNKTGYMGDIAGPGCDPSTV